MEQYMVASVGTAQAYDSNNNQVLYVKTLTEQGINFSSTAEEARGGAGNALLGKFFHDSALTVNMTDQLFNLQYLALNCGGAITASADVMTQEQVTVGTANKIVVTNTPVAFNGEVCGWAKKSNESDSHYVKVVFSGTEATLDGAQVGDVYCVKYFHNSPSARSFDLNTAYIPNVLHFVLTFPLFKAGTSKDNYTSSSKVGEIQIDIPQLQLEGNQELALTSGGIATSSLNGSALSTFSGDGSCSDGGRYATIKEVIYGKGALDGVKAITVEASDIELSASETKDLIVWAFYNDGTIPSVIENSLLTFTSGNNEVATVNANGTVTGVGAGSTNIEVVATDNTSLSAYAVVTVA